MSLVMTRHHWVAATLLSTVSALACAQDFPARRPGLWEINMMNDGKPGVVAKHCVDEKTDQAMQKMAQTIGAECSQSGLKRDGDAIVSSSVCKFGDNTISSKSRTTGDFKSTIRTEVDSQYSPPLAGKATGKVIIEAKWSGACPATMKAGDMEMPGGMKVNVNQIMQGTGKASAAGKP